MTEDKILIFKIEKIIKDNYDDHEKTIELVRAALDNGGITKDIVIDLLIKVACSFSSDIEHALLASMDRY